MLNINKLEKSITGLTLAIASISGLLFIPNKVLAATHLRVCTKTPNGVVNIRSGPGTNYSIVAQAQNGQDLHYWYKGMMMDENSKPPRDRSGYYWVKVSPNPYEMGYVGYLRADLLGCGSMNLQNSLTSYH